MATLRGTKAVAGASSTTLTVPLPSGVVSGDVGILTIVYNPTNGDVSPPTGWSLVEGSEHSFSASMRARMYTKTFAGPESSAVFTHPSANKMAGSVVVFNSPQVGTLLFSVQSGDDDCPVVSAAGNSVGSAFWLQRGGTIPSSLAPPPNFAMASGTDGVAFGAGGGQTCAGVATNMVLSTSHGGGAWTPNVANAGTITYTVAVTEEEIVTPPAGWRFIEVVGGVVQNLEIVERSNGQTTPLSIWSTTTTTTTSPVEALTYPAYAAHRGGANVGQRVENTLDAYERSLVSDHPDTVLEMDLCLLGSGGSATLEDRIALTHEGSELSADGKILEADGVTIVSGPITGKTVAQWDTYLVKPRTGIAGTPKPASRWVQIVNLIQSNPNKVVIPELKSDDVVQPFIDSVISNNLQGNVIAQSFEYTRAVATANAGISSCWLTSSFTTTSAASVKAAGIDHVGFDRTNPNLTSLCSEAHSADLKVWVYTVNSTSNRDIAAAAGADGFFTDVPTVVNK